MDYLNLLKKIGPTPEELAAKQKEMEREKAAKEKAIKEGAKEEIKEMQGRISELREDPGKTWNRPYVYEDDDCCVTKFQEVWDMREKYDDAVHEVAKILMKNAEDEAEATQGYTDQVNHLQCLLKVSLECVKYTNKKLLKPEGPENKPGKNEVELRAKLEHYQKVSEWCSRELEKTQEKISDEISHQSALLAAYIEFTGIKSTPDDAKESARIIGDVSKT